MGIFKRIGQALVEEIPSEVYLTLNHSMVLMIVT